MFFSSKMYDFVMDLLMKDLPVEYYYHNYQHTQNIIQQVEEIGRNEQCSNEEIDLLKVGALWHDAGYLHVYDGHEAEGCNLVKQYFPGFGMNSRDTELVCGMIMATRVPQDPKNKLEQIIADADLEYLGTPAAPDYADLLYQELKHRNPSLTREAWNKMQVSFITSHHYFTSYCRENREPYKQVYLNQLIEKTA